MTYEKSEYAGKWTVASLRVLLVVSENAVLSEHGRMYIRLKSCPPSRLSLLLDDEIICIHHSKVR